MNNNNIGRHLAQLNNLIHREISRNECHKDDNTTPEISRASSGILIYLNNHKNTPVYQRDLEREFTVRRSTISKVLSLLESKGLIARVAVSSDKRLKKIELTDKAINQIDRLEKGAVALEQKMSNGISKEELDAFISTLTKIKNNLKETEEQN